jgi:hypothetical protein
VRTTKSRIEESRTTKEISMTSATRRVTSTDPVNDLDNRIARYPNAAMAQPPELSSPAR